MKKLTALLPLLLIVAFFSCQEPKSRQLTYEQAENTPPLVLYTSLDDSLPPKAIQSLNLQQRVLGLKVKYMTGQYASYFEYEAKGDQVLETISRLPFSLNASRADTLCLRMDYRYLEFMKAEMSPVELENAPAFWTAGDDFEVYECNKYPYLHTVLINRKSNKVLHRVALLG
jgi:hypothetical protein